MTKKGFNPPKYLAKCCNTIIFSTRPGEFVQCKCGECYVDQTPYYTRGGGDYLELIEEKEKFGEDNDD
jgi:hypothetical protein